MKKDGKKPLPSFYRRTLPSPAIPFSSQEGRKLFQQALVAGTMDCYFPLAEQFTTQAEPAFCGLSTLVMVLNAMSVDPGRQWKGPWRWFAEPMLDCCSPLEIVERDGITLSKFVCLARCQGVDVALHRGDESEEEQFRALVKAVCTGTKPGHIVVSYSRKAFNQTGDGHFSPIGGYHAESDKVLVMDVARFKYPPHWLSLTELFASMKRKDPTTQRSRGYVHLQALSTTGTLLRFIPQRSTLESQLKQRHAIVDWWRQWTSNGEIKEGCLQEEQPPKWFFSFVRSFCSLKLIPTLDVTRCLHRLDLLHAQAANQILSGLEKQKWFSFAKEVVEGCVDQDEACGELPSCRDIGDETEDSEDGEQSCDVVISQPHVATLLALAAWTPENEIEGRCGGHVCCHDHKLVAESSGEGTCGKKGCSVSGTLLWREVSHVKKLLSSLVEMVDAERAQVE